MGIFLNRVGAPSSGKYQLDTAVATEAFMYEDYVDDCTYAYADLMETMAMVDGEVVTEAVGGIIAFITANLGKIIAFIVAVVAAIIAIIAAMKNGGGSKDDGKSGGSSGGSTLPTREETKKKNEEIVKKNEEMYRKIEAQALKDAEESDKRVLKSEADLLNKYFNEYKTKCDRIVSDAKTNYNKVLTDISNTKIHINVIEASLLGKSKVVSDTLNKLTDFIEDLIDTSESCVNACKTTIDYANHVSSRINPNRIDVSNILGDGRSEDEVYDDMKSTINLITTATTDKMTEYRLHLIRDLEDVIGADDTDRPYTTLITYGECKRSCSTYTGRNDIVNAFNTTANGLNEIKSALDKMLDAFDIARDDTSNRLDSISDTIVKNNGGDTHNAPGLKVVTTAKNLILRTVNQSYKLISVVANISKLTNRYAKHVGEADVVLKNFKTVANTRLKEKLKSIYAYGRNPGMIAKSVIITGYVGDFKPNYPPHSTITSRSKDPNARAKFDSEINKLISGTEARMDSEYNRAVDEINRYITDLGQYGFDTSDKLEKMSG